MFYRPKSTLWFPTKREFPKDRPAYGHLRLAWTPQDVAEKLASDSGGGQSAFAENLEFNRPPTRVDRPFSSESLPNRPLFPFG